MIEYDKFQKLLQHLIAQFENYSSLDASLPAITQEAVAESTIQRFETCFDSLWKVLKRYLNEEIGVADLPNGPKPIFRIANENRLFRDEQAIERWIDYVNKRNSTAHDYDGEKAKEALAIMARFVE